MEPTLTQAEATLKEKLADWKARELVKIENEKAKLHAKTNREVVRIRDVEKKELENLINRIKEVVELTFIPEFGHEY
jgi:predicted transcriptional regulator